MCTKIVTNVYEDCDMFCKVDVHGGRTMVLVS